MASQARTELRCYKDWEKGQSVIFSHGWPLCADALDSQMLYLGQNGYRVIAHDRRSHGRSMQTWHGSDMTTYADGLPELIAHLELKDADQIVPFADAGELQAKLIKGAKLKVYAGAPHGMPVAHADLINPDLLSFIRS